jgi:hypothetical protein
MIALRGWIGLLLLIGLSWPGADGQTSATITAANVDPLTVANKRYDADKELARLTKKYGLTEEQKAKIQPALLEQQKHVHALGEDQSMSDLEWDASVRKVHQQTVLLVKAKMTDAQAGKYLKDEAKQSKKSHDVDDGDDGPDGSPPDGPPPGGGPGGGGPPM